MSKEAIKARQELEQIARVCGATPYVNRHYPDKLTMAFGPDAWEAFCNKLTEQPAQQEPVAYAVKTVGGKKWHSIHAVKESSDKWLEYRVKEQAQGEMYEQFALYTSPPAQRKPLGYAGITIWGGEATVTKVFTEAQMELAREPRSLIEAVVGQCLDELAAHGIKENT